MDDSKFNESIYLKMHDDVRIAVEQGLFNSGYHHYTLCGKEDGRNISRLDLESHSIRDYTKVVRNLIAEHPDNYDLAMARAIGSPTLEVFRDFGDKQCAILQRLGLTNGQSIYDLACGSGRTASALQRHGWVGDYRGADIIPELIDYASAKNPGFQFFVYPDFSINAPDASQDIIFAWSLFTHLTQEEIFLYAQDCYRCLKPGGTFVFSFLTLQDPRHREMFNHRIAVLAKGLNMIHLDTFINKETISIMMTEMLGFKLIEFIDGNDPSATPTGCFGQYLAVFTKWMGNNKNHPGPK